VLLLKDEKGNMPVKGTSSFRIQFRSFCIIKRLDFVDVMPLMATNNSIIL
jgi:hypothetical protein